VLNNFLARKELTEEQLNLCLGHQVCYLNGTVPKEPVLNNFLARKELTEKQFNLCWDIRYVILMGQCHKNHFSTTFWPERS
jgi:hypothetical protein